MEQILGLILAILLSGGASALDKWWKRHKAQNRRAKMYSQANKPLGSRTGMPVPPLRTPAVHKPLPVTQAFTDPAEEGARVTSTSSLSLPDCDESAEKARLKHYNRWKQAIIDAEVLARPF